MKKRSELPVSDLQNYALNSKIVSHSPLNEIFPKNKIENAIDGDIRTSWITHSDGEKFIEIDLLGERQIGCVQFLTGWESVWRPKNSGSGSFDGEKEIIDRQRILSSIGKTEAAKLAAKQKADGVGHNYNSYIYNFKLEYFDGDKWLPIAQENDGRNVAVDLSADYYDYALEWNENEIVFYFNGVPYRRIKNEFCHHEAPVFLSLAILKTLARIDDSLDKTKMSVEYVRIWQDADNPQSTMRDRTADELKLSFR